MGGAGLVEARKCRRGTRERCDERRVDDGGPWAIGAEVGAFGQLRFASRGNGL
jgi:hypothetical protein